MNLMSEADYRLGRARKERLESEGVNPQDLDQETIAELLQVISMEVVVGVLVVGSSSPG